MDKDVEIESKVYAEVNVDECRNENLIGEKSMQAHAQDAKQDQISTEKRRSLKDRQPDEVKASAELLPEDAESKSKNSAEESL